MYTMEKSSVERLILTGFGMTFAVLLGISVIALNTAGRSAAVVVGASSVMLLAVLALLAVRIRKVLWRRLADEHRSEERRVGKECRL